MLSLLHTRLDTKRVMVDSPHPNAVCTIGAYLTPLLYNRYSANRHVRRDQSPVQLRKLRECPSEQQASRHEVQIAEVLQC